MGDQGRTIAAAGAFSVHYGEGMLKGVNPHNAARFAAPGGIPINSNHPVFVYGHLAIYAANMANLLAIAPLAATPAGWEDLFKNGVECRDDKLATIYPSLETVSKNYLGGYRHILDAVANASDETLNKPNPMGGRMTEMLPTIGAAVNFLLTGHPMSHLGQLSAWRRAMGLGSAF